MQTLAGFLGLLCLVWSVPAGAQVNPQASGTTVFIPPALLKNPKGLLPELTEEDAKLGQVLVTGTGLVKAKRQSEAIFLYYDRVASVYEAKYKDRNTEYYAARSLIELMAYMTKAAVSGKTAMGVSMNWSSAYFLKAYALIDLSRPAEAKAPLDRALALSPDNAHFLAELGYFHQLRKDWPAAMATFKKAESAAATSSPEEVRNIDLARAWRGMGYVLVETGRIAEAEALYRKCLELDQNDAGAKHELQYIASLKTKRQ